MLISTNGLPEQLFTTPFLAVDTETTGLQHQRGDRPFAFSFTTFEGEDFYARFPVDNTTRKVQYDERLVLIWNLIQERIRLGRPCIFHNATFDLSHIWTAYREYRGLGSELWSGLQLPPLREIQSFPAIDTIILAHCANSARATYALKPLARELCNIPITDQSDLRTATVEARKKARKLGFPCADSVEADYHLAPVGLVERYAVGDTQRTMRIFKMFLPLLTEQSQGPFSHYKEIVEMEHRLMLSVLRMNLQGVRMDPNKIQELKTYYQSVIDEEGKKIEILGYGDLNPRSSKQKAQVFYEELGFEPEIRKRKKKDGTKTKTVTVDKKALEKFSGQSPLAKALLTISEAQHQLNSFIVPFERESIKSEDGYLLYPCFNSVGPRTGRMSCSNPNLQNITGENSPQHKTEVLLKARECFIPRRDCCWMAADYSQIEIWVSAYLSKDKTMMDILESGKSIHDLTTERMFHAKADYKDNYNTYRKLAKIITFSILYGSGPTALSDLLGISKEEATQYYNTFWSTYVGLRRYSESLENQIKHLGWVKDVFGRPYFIEKRWAYKALNYMVQGSAAGVLKRAHLNVDELFQAKYPGAKILLDVHDEVIAECPYLILDDNLVKDTITAMQGGFHRLFGMKKPFSIEVSFCPRNWQEKVHYEVNH